MDEFGKVCANQKCTFRKPVLEVSCPLCREADYCDTRCLKQDRLRHRESCAFVSRVFKRRLNDGQVDPPSLILNEVADSRALRSELFQLYVTQLMDKEALGCMVVWLTELNELAVACNSGSRVKSTWFTFVPEKDLAKDVRMFGLLEMAKHCVPISRMVIVGVVVLEDSNAHIRNVHARAFEVPPDTIKKVSAKVPT